MAQPSPDSPLAGIESDAGAAAPRNRYVFIAPAFLTLAALMLRLWSITWSLPNYQHLLTYHPDEGVNLHVVLRPHLDLDFYNYGGLYFYLWQGAVAVNGTYGLVQREDPQTGSAALHNVYVPPSQTIGAMLLVGRLLTAFLGGLTVWAVWALGKRLHGERAGIVAGFVAAILPVAVVHGHYATVDVPATLFVTIALIWAAKLLDSPNATNAALAGAAAGLAGATKYNCALVALAPAAALVFGARAQSGSKASIAGLAGALIGGFVGGFLLGCPGVLVNPGGFWRDVSFEAAKSREGMGLLFAGTGNGWLYHLTSSMRFGFGLPMLAWALAGAAVAVARREKPDLLLAAFLVPYYLLIGWAQVRFLRYILPITPVFAVWAGRLSVEQLSSKWVSWAVRTGAILAGAATVTISLALDHLFGLAPPQDQALAWLRTNAPRGSSIGFVTVPWYYSPPLSPFFTAPATGPVHARYARQVEEYSLRPPEGVEWDPAVLQPSPPDYFVISDIESEDALRIGLPATLPFTRLFASEYTDVVLENRPTIFGIDLGKPPYVPNDWLYPYPTITIYQRKSR